MKKLFLVSAAVFFLTGIQANAQPAFLTMDSIDINNINAVVLVHGDMWYNPATDLSHCDFPNGSGKNIGFAGALWMSGYDAGNNLHIAAQTYRQDGNDYWPGPLDGSDTLTYATSQNWACIWKVTRKEIQIFQALSATGTATSSNTAAAIWAWPANGNIYAKGNAGVPLTVIDNVAPFIDLNGNGIYEPQLGDYPDVKGDEALWWVFSDNGASHSETNGKPLGVEVHAMAYAYQRWNSIDNVIYYQYNIINKSANTYQNFRVGQFADMDLGYYNDDYIGCDTNRGLGIIYNGTPIDAVYGSNMPMAGITLRAGSGASPGSFMYYNNDMTSYGNPTSDVQYNNYLRSEFRDGAHATDDFTAAGIMTTAHGSGPSTNYVFNGNPAVSSQWSECSSGNIPGDRRFILTTGDMELNAGATIEITSILLATNPGPENACGDTGINFNHIDSLADTALSVYYGGGLPPIPLAVTNVPASNSVTIYPNPAHDKLYIENTASYTGEETTTIYNTIGQVINVPITKTWQKLEADISMLPNGLYLVLYRAGNKQTTVKFLKE